MVMSPWVVGAVSCVIDLSGVRVEAGVKGPLSTPPLLSFLLALSSTPQCSCSLVPALVCAGLAALVHISQPLLVVAMWIPHPNSLTFAGPCSLLHSLIWISLCLRRPGPSLLMPLFTLTYQLHCHSYPPTPHTCFNLCLPVFICAHLVSIVVVVVVAVTHIVSIYLIKCLAYLVSGTSITGNYRKHNS